MKTLNDSGLKKIFNLIKDNFFNKNDAQEVLSIDVDTTPTNDSDNLVTSGGVKSALDVKYTKPSNGIPASDLADVNEVGTLGIDTAPTTSSNNLVTSGGVKSAIDAKYTKPSTGIPASDLASGVIPETEQATELNVDTEVIEGSDNLITSGAVYDFIATLDGNGVAY